MLRRNVADAELCVACVRFSDSRGNVGEYRTTVVLSIKSRVGVLYTLVYIRDESGMKRCRSTGISCPVACVAAGCDRPTSSFATEDIVSTIAELDDCDTLQRLTTVSTWHMGMSIC